MFVAVAFIHLLASGDEIVARDRSKIGCMCGQLGKRVPCSVMCDDEPFLKSSKFSDVAYGE